jgi:hypothetical protein
VILPRRVPHTIISRNARIAQGLALVNTAKFRLIEDFSSSSALLEALPNTVWSPPFRPQNDTEVRRELSEVLRTLSAITAPKSKRLYDAIEEQIGWIATRLRFWHPWVVWESDDMRQLPYRVRWNIVKYWNEWSGEPETRAEFWTKVYDGKPRPVNWPSPLHDLVKQCKAMGLK